MKIKSNLLGEMECEEKDIISFPRGIPAFEAERSFLQIAMGEGAPFYYLQSVVNPDLCLVMADPFIFFPGYSIEIGEEEQQLLLCSKQEELFIYVIVTVPEDFKQSTANLLAPVVINQEKKIGFQFVAVNTEYTTRHQIFSNAQAQTAAAAEEG